MCGLSLTGGKEKEKEEGAKATILRVCASKQASQPASNNRHNSSILCVVSHFGERGGEMDAEEEAKEDGTKTKTRKTHKTKQDSPIT